MPPRRRGGGTQRRAAWRGEDRPHYAHGDEARCVRSEGEDRVVGWRLIVREGEESLEFESGGKYIYEWLWARPVSTPCRLLVVPC